MNMHMQSTVCVVSKRTNQINESVEAVRCAQIVPMRAKLETVFYFVVQKIKVIFPFFLLNRILFNQSTATYSFISCFPYLSLGFCLIRTSCMCAINRRVPHECHFILHGRSHMCDTCHPTQTICIHTNCKQIHCISFTLLLPCICLQFKTQNKKKNIQNYRNN